jgi:hypothetical protein
MTRLHEPTPMIESLESRAFCSATPLSTSLSSPIQTKPTTSALYVDPNTVQKTNVVIAIIAILIG